MYLQFYTSNGIRWDDALDRVQSGDGEVFVCVVKTPKKGTQQFELAYGMFYRDSQGTLCDCLQPTRTALKTTRSAEVAFQFLREAYPDCWDFSLPVLDEHNVIETGKIGDRTVLKHKAQVRLNEQRS